MSYMNTQFILVDDSKLDLMVFEKMLKSTLNVNEVMSFQFPEKAIDYLSSRTNDKQTIIFLDINMPVINGFLFLKLFENLPSSQTNQTEIYIVTSSQNHIDHTRSKESMYVKGVITKPISALSISNIFV